MAESVMSRDELLARIQAGWDEFHAYLKTLTEAQIVTPTDAAGWTVKDHVMHLVVWEDSVNAAFQGQNRREQMGVDKETWGSRDYDKINGVIQQQHKDKPFTEVLKAFQEVHQRLVTKIQSLSDADLQRPYRYFQPDSTADNPVIDLVVGNTYNHYAEHTPWIAAIVAEG